MRYSYAGRIQSIGEDGFHSFIVVKDNSGKVLFTLNTIINAGIGIKRVTWPFVPFVVEFVEVKIRRLERRLLEQFLCLSDY